MLNIAPDIRTASINFGLVSLLLTLSNNLFIRIPEALIMGK